MIAGLLGLAGAIAVAVLAAWKTRKSRMVRVDPKVQEETLRRAFKVVFGTYGKPEE